MHHSARLGRLRPLPPYEPPPSGTPPKPFDSDQLALDLALCPRPAVAVRHTEAVHHDIPAPPSGECLLMLLTALLEAWGGRRPLDPLRTKLSPAMFEALRRRTGAGPARRFALRSLRTDRPHPGALEVCATAMEEHHVYAVVARFEVSWSGWKCTLLDRIGHQRQRQVRTPAA